MSIFKSISKVFASIVSIVKKVVKTIIDVVAKLINFVKDLISRVFSAIGSALSSVARVAGWIVIIIVIVIIAIYLYPPLGAVLAEFLAGSVGAALGISITTANIIGFLAAAALLVGAVGLILDKEAFTKGIREAAGAATAVVKEVVAGVVDVATGVVGGVASGLLRNIPPWLLILGGCTGLYLLVDEE